MAKINWSKQSEHLTIDEAREIIVSVQGQSVTRATVINWVREHGLGWQPHKHGVWNVKRDKLKEFLNGQ